MVLQPIKEDLSAMTRTERGDGAAPKKEWMSFQSKEMFQWRRQSPHQNNCKSGLSLGCYHLEKVAEISQFEKGMTSSSTMWARMQLNFDRVPGMLAEGHASF